MPLKPDITSDYRKQIVSQLILNVKDGSESPKLKWGEMTCGVNNFYVGLIISMSPKKPLLNLFECILAHPSVYTYK